MKSSLGDRIPGPVRGFNGHGSQATSGQNQTNSSGSSQASAAKVSFSPHACTTAGKMNATNCVPPPGPLFYHHLQIALMNTLERRSQCYKALVPLTQDCLDKLIWWDNNMCRWNGKALIQREVDLVINSDASLEGWGACCSKQRTGVHVPSRNV